MRERRVEEPDGYSGAGGRGSGRGELGVRYALLPLRVFLGITFVYAGLDKLSDPNFLDSDSATSMLAQMTATAGASPIGGLVDWAAGQPTLTGLGMAFGELAVGLGMLFGLFARVAAVGGALISLSLWLTVSWSISPYYLGNDLVYLMAWLPLIAAGAPYLSLDAWRAARVRKVAREGGGAEAVRRRTLVDGGVTALGVALLGGLSGGLAHLLGGRDKDSPRSSARVRPSGEASEKGTPAASPKPSDTRTPGGPTVAAARVPVGGAARVVDPSSDDPVYVMQPREGEFVALSGVCTHQGCEVGAPRGGKFTCPCHGSQFDAGTGDAVKGPARSALTRYPVRKVGDDLQVEL
jgi:thiosulfate dehydrogenase [quinone] large subunit